MNDLLTKDFLDLLENFKKADKHVWSNLHMEEDELKKVCEKQQKRALVIADRFRQLAMRFEGYGDDYTKTIFYHRQTDEYLKKQEAETQRNIDMMEGSYREHLEKSREQEEKETAELFNRILEKIDIEKSPE